MVKVQGRMERWPHDYKKMKHEVEIMVIDKELSVGFCFVGLSCVEK